MSPYVPYVPSNTKTFEPGPFRFRFRRDTTVSESTMFKYLYEYFSDKSFINRQLANRLFSFVAITSAITLAGCATIDPQAVRTQTQGKTISIASTLGQDLELKWVGTTMFHNEYGLVSVPTWSIDEVAVNAVSSALQATGRYAAINKVGNIKRIGEAMPILPPHSKSDYLILIERRHGGDPMFATNQSFQGIGIAQRTFMGILGPQTRAYISLQLELFDVAMAKSMGTRGAFDHWQITQKLKSGGSYDWTNDKSPTPIIENHDLAELQQPVTSRLVGVVEKLLTDMGLR